MLVLTAMQNKKQTNKKQEQFSYFEYEHDIQHGYEIYMIWYDN